MTRRPRYALVCYSGGFIQSYKNKQAAREAAERITKKHPNIKYAFVTYKQAQSIMNIERYDHFLDIIAMDYDEPWALDKED